MEIRINIAEILRNKPHGVKLYSPIFGDCTYCYVREDTNDICVKRPYNVMSFFNFEGLYNTAGECLLFPSKEMRNWSKFAWKKGDALSCGVDNLCIFEKWANKEYTEFYAKFVTPNYSGNTFKTEKWSKETNEAVIKQYISNIEEFKGGKLNLTTLEIEKTQPEFKDGDILSCDEDSYTKHTTLILHKDENITESIVSLIRHKELVETNEPINDFLLSRLYPAREDEKQQLFSALSKKNKRWDSKKKQIVDLKPKCEFKPFDKVLGRNEKDEVWEAELFSHYREESQYPFRCIGFSRKYCIPYNEETAHLLGTTDEWEGGKHD